ncbi:MULTISPECIES: hypothetical protein [unclassified Mesorhizobium]|uniref:hypothetical protein n=1 Tax=unclassified Mesorhizobium TaxID=325217 RepID=UPI00080108D8|nr:MULTISPECIES: hypothetical protein [unclassified Mesorhizobium]OBQ81567.1 hypothetical protein A9K71_27165 [Mesorhizobium sp. WSM3873]PBB77593.1 hypothetical protein CK218_29615 [Mesorhizobium sp. WSM3879]
MRNAIAEAVFKPKPTARESKGDATTQAAREIMDKETERESKTQRLRLARLAKEAAAPAGLPKAKRASAKRRVAA